MVFWPYGLVVAAFMRCGFAAMLREDTLLLRILSPAHSASRNTGAHRLPYVILLPLLRAAPSSSSWRL